MKIPILQENETDIQTAIVNFIALFKILQDKDVFENYYKQQLTKRLLSRRASIDIENLIISKLQVCNLIISYLISTNFN